MIYVMSDLHGEYKKFNAMLKKINFTDRDELFILGDIIDRGPEPIKILKQIMDMSNVYPLLGNHEVMAYDVLKKLSVAITDAIFDRHITENVMMDIIEWQQNGGSVTMQQFYQLSIEDREKVLNYLEEFYQFEAIDVGIKTYFLVHAGLGNFTPEKKISQYTLEELVFMTPDYEKQYFSDNDIYIVCGHTPTKAICNEWKIYHSHNNICIDCGAHFNGKLACLCLDTLEEFYI